MDNVIEKIREVAAKHAPYDNEDFDLSDYCGSNIDDAFSLGAEDGEIWMARTLLKMIEDKNAPVVELVDTQG